MTLQIGIYNYYHALHYKKLAQMWENYLEKNARKMTDSEFKSVYSTMMHCIKIYRAHYESALSI